jgi:hypothetical protein
MADMLRPGIELVDPSRQRKVDEANAKWCAVLRIPTAAPLLTALHRFKEGTFSLAPGARGTAIPGSSGGAGSMGPPALPPAKKPRVE